MTFSASICKNNEITIFFDQIVIVGNTCPWFKHYVCIVKQSYVYVITRSDGKKMLIFKSITEGGGGGISHLILVHLCRRYFSDPPYSCVPEADCRMYTYSCMIYIVLLPIDVSILCHVDLSTL